MPMIGIACRVGLHAAVHIFFCPSGSISGKTVWNGYVCCASEGRPVSVYLAFGCSSG